MSDIQQSVDNKTRRDKQIELKAVDARIKASNASLYAHKTYRGVTYGTTQYGSVRVVADKSLPVCLDGTFTSPALVHALVDDLIAKGELNVVVN